MDARQRLNHLRRLETKNKSKVKAKQRLTDLRDLLIANNQKTNNNLHLIHKNSVKNRIGFKTRGNGFKQRQQVMTNQKNIRTIGLKGVKQQNNQKRVLLTKDQRIPKVVVNFDEIDDNSRNRVNVSKKLMTTAKREPKRQIQTLMSTQPIIIPQLVPTYAMPSNPYMADDSKHTVLVSNLNKSITQSDINELFGEIGQMIRCSKLNPTVALIVYESSLDAKNACQTYHNRLLDGQPMQCNVLNQTDNEYTIPARARVQPNFQCRQNSSLLASQLKQINELQPKQLSAAQGFSSNRGNSGMRSNIRFRVNV